MKRGLQKQLAIKAKVTEGFISQVLNGYSRPSWPTAKRIAAASYTKPDLWMEGTPDEMKAAIVVWGQKQEREAA